jgi:hypothetical protein
VVKAAHVCEETIRKRLGEFKSTNTAQLTRGELNQIEQIEQDPYKFQIQEKNFEPPQITRRPILKSLKMEPESAADDHQKPMKLKMEGEEDDGEEAENGGCVEALDRNEGVLTEIHTYMNEKGGQLEQ